MTTQNPKPKKRVLLGRPLKHTNRQLEQLAQVTSADIEAAKTFWRRHARGKLRGLLDALPLDKHGKPITPNS